VSGQVASPAISACVNHPALKRSKSNITLHVCGELLLAARFSVDG
jgi:hypothetical protein